jgi:hypothetical protein
MTTRARKPPREVWVVWDGNNAIALKDEPPAHLVALMGMAHGRYVLADSEPEPKLRKDALKLSKGFAKAVAAAAREYAEDAVPAPAKRRARK